MRMNQTWKIRPSAKNIRFVVVKDKAIFLYYFYHNPDATLIIQTSEILFLTNIKIQKLCESSKIQNIDFYE